MGKQIEVTFSAEEAQFLIERASQSSLPQDLGEEKFTVADQSIAADELSELVLVLKGYSPWLQGWGKDRLVLFGDKEDWKITKDAAGTITACEHQEPGKSYKVRLSQEAVNGAMWVLFLALYPIVRAADDKVKHRPVAPMTAGQICWPIAKKLGKVGALRTFLKLDKTRSRVWADDDQEKVADVAAAK